MRTLTAEEAARVRAYKGFEAVLDLYTDGLVTKEQMFEIIEILSE